jgi:hypothetical protein
MSLSQAEKDRIIEEEHLRFDTRMKDHMQSAGKAGGACGACGHKPGCGGCRIWAAVLGLVLLFLVFRSFACTREDRGRFYGYGDRDAMNRGDQAPAGPLSAPAHN